jgi:hypothetical protein
MDEKNTISKAASLAGWYGSFAILGAYGIVALGIIGPEHWLGLALNLTGGAGATYISWRQRSPQLMFLNGMWVVFTTVSIAKLAFF